MKSQCKRDEVPFFFQDIQLNHCLKAAMHLRFLKADRKTAAPNASARKFIVFPKVSRRIGLNVEVSPI